MGLNISGLRRAGIAGALLFVLTNIACVYTLRAASAEEPFFWPTSPLEVTDDLVLIVTLGHDGTTEEQDGWKLIMSTPILSPKSIQGKAIEALKRDMRPGVLEHTTICLPKDPKDTWEFPLKRTTLVLQIDYAARVFHRGETTEAIGSLMVTPMFPLFEDPRRHLKSLYQFEPARYPTLFYISDDPDELVHTLDTAISASLGRIAPNICLSGERSKDAGTDTSCFKENE